MSLGDLLREVSIREDADGAKAIASIFNADRNAVKLLEGRSNYTPEDIHRLGRIIGEYTPSNSTAAKTN